MAGKRSAFRAVILIVVLLIVAVGTFVYLRETRKPRELVLSGTLEARTVNVGSLAGGPLFVQGRARSGVA